VLGRPVGRRPRRRNALRGNWTGQRLRGRGPHRRFGGALSDDFRDGHGTDTIYGGPGNDGVILVKDGTPDTVTCGSGHDEVFGDTSNAILRPTAKRSMSSSFSVTAPDRGTLRPRKLEATAQSLRRTVVRAGARAVCRPVWEGRELEASRLRPRHRETGWNMRGRCALVGFASVGLVAASLLLGAPASARDVINGTNGPDNLRGTADSDTLRGFGGSDRVHAFPGADHIFGGSGHDVVFAGRGDDTIRGRTQGDGLVGRPGDDTIYGGAGRDDIDGGTGADVIFGGAMRDAFLSDGRGTDTIYGGRGNDIVVLTKDGTPDTAHCGPGRDVVYGATPMNTVAGDCEEVHVAQPPGCGRLPQRVLPPLREAARC
jgi:Ca2+-binding RTX toxin-like protein